MEQEKTSLQIRELRNSSIELLRLLMMLCVIFYHMFGTLRDTVGDNSRVLLFFYTILHVAVPVFILISGYFSIKLSINKIIGFWLYCVLWLVITYFAYLGITHSLFSLRDLVMQFLPFSNSGGHWFVPYYFTLMLLSPLLNQVNNLSKKKHLVLILGLMGYMFYFDIVNRAINGPGCSDIVSDGHSLMYFVSLYLIGRYLFRISEISKKIKNGGGVFYCVFYRRLIIGAIFTRFINQTISWVVFYIPVSNRNNVCIMHTIFFR